MPHKFMSRPPMSEKTFAQHEQEGWQRNAADYDEIDLPTTIQAIAPILDSVGDLHGLHVLELAKRAFRVQRCW